MTDIPTPEDVERLADKLDHTLQMIASNGSVPQFTWDQHCEAVLKSMEDLRALRAALIEAESERDEANARDEGSRMALATVTAERDKALDPIQGLRARLIETQNEHDEARAAWEEFATVPVEEIDAWRAKLNERFGIGKGMLKPIEEPSAVTLRAKGKDND